MSFHDIRWLRFTSLAAEDRGNRPREAVRQQSNASGSTSSSWPLRLKKSIAARARVGVTSLAVSTHHGRGPRERVRWTSDRAACRRRHLGCSEAPWAALRARRLLSNPTTAPQLWRRERVLMPHFGPSHPLLRTARGSADRRAETAPPSLWQSKYEQRVMCISTRPSRYVSIWRCYYGKRSTVIGAQLACATAFFIVPAATASLQPTSILTRWIFHDTDGRNLLTAIGH